MSTEEISTSEAASPSPPREEIVAKGALYYRMTRILMVVMFVGMGSWFAYDGWIGWPEENKKAELEPTKYKRHSGTDILLQKVLASTLPPLGIALLIWTFYNSRGAYRLDMNNQLHIPGHPAVPLESITRIDKRLWDRKGIAFIDYAVDRQTEPGRLKLDDFVYEREPTDEIFKRVETFVLAETQQMQQQQAQQQDQTQQTETPGA